MRLLHLVEQDDAVRVPAHGLGELAALVVAHVSGRRADEALHGELLHVLGHVDADERTLVVKEALGERLGELGLAHAGGAEEEETANRPVGVGETRPAAAHGRGDGGDRLVLADDALVELVLEVLELVHLALHHLRDGHAGPGGHDLGDLLARDLLLEQPALLLTRGEGLLGLVVLVLEGRDGGVAQLGCLGQVTLARHALHLELGVLDLGLEVLRPVDRPLLVLPVCLHAVELLAGRRDLLAQRGETLLGGVVLLLDERLLLDLHLRELTVDRVDVDGHGVELHAQARGGLVDEVDGLVGQKPVGDVAVREVGRGDERAVGDADAVVLLVALLKAAQNRDRVLDRGLGDQHGLEPAGERLVLLDVLAVLVERGRADGMKLAAGERRLQDVAGVHGALGRTGADDRVELVNEQDDAPVGLLDLLEHALESVLELATVLGTRHERGHVELDDVLVLDGRGNVARHDALGEALDDGGLADAGLADEHGVVLGAAREHLDGAANLLHAAYHGVELALAGEVGHVATVLLESLELRLCLL